jgi:signal transduction histidine kinase
MDYTILFAIILLIVAAWYAWRYHKLRREIDQYAGQVRQQNVETSVRELQNLSGTVASILSTFDLQLSTVDSERDRLATVLDQITDGVLIADEQGIIQFANPAATRLFQTSNPINRSITEVIRHHQLVEAWRRCQQTRLLQSESVEVPTRHQYLQLVVIPD